MQQQKSNISVLDYFKSSQPDIWKKGIERAKYELDENLISSFFKMCLDERYILIQNELINLIKMYENGNIINFDKVISTLENENMALKLTSVVFQLSRDSFYEYCLFLFDSNSEYRDLLLEKLGSDYLTILDVEFLYNDDNKKELISLLYCAGFMKSNEINSWIAKLLFFPDDEISSSAVFALGKHGTRGLYVLVDNLTELSDRLKMVSIDLLIYNKVNIVYEEFPELLSVKNDVIANKLFTALSNLGDKGVRYIVDCLKICNSDYYKPLLDILKRSKDNSYLNSIYYLVRNENIRETIWSIYFNQNAIDLLKRVVEYEDEKIIDSLISFGINNNSEILFEYNLLTEKSLRYFLDNLELDFVIRYFENINYDSKFIEDYRTLTALYSGIVVMKSFEVKNGLEEYVSKYFELEQDQLLAEQELSVFYKGMENWIETKDAKELNKSLEVKQMSNSDILTIEEKRAAFTLLLTDNEKIEIDKYEKAKNDIPRNFRLITYRLKTFALKLITENSFQNLIN